MADAQGQPSRTAGGFFDGALSDVDWWTRPRPNAAGAWLARVAPGLVELGEPPTNDQQMAALLAQLQAQAEASPATGWPAPVGMALDAVHAMQGTPIETAGNAITDGLDQLGRWFGFTVPSQPPQPASVLDDRLAQLNAQIVALTKRVPKPW